MTPVIPPTTTASNDARSVTSLSAERRAGCTRSLLDSLHCPYCGSPLRVESSAPAEASLVEDAVLVCACHEYPVVSGIPILQQIDGLDRVVTLQRQREYRLALLQALDVFRIRWAQQSRWHRLRYRQSCRRLVSHETISFEEAAQHVRKPKAFADYLVHRYANPSFLAAVGPMVAVGSLPTATHVNGGRILDLACGAGHASFLMQVLHPELSVIAADQDFVSLYLAKRFVAPSATHVCWDVEATSPFPDRYFDAVFCLDAFHYFRSKSGVVAELNRTTRPDGSWVFPHLHNKLQHNLVAGIPLSPEHYLECLGISHGRMFDEAGLLRSLWQEHSLDLQSEQVPSHLNNAPTLTYIRGAATMWRRHEGFPSRMMREMSLLTVNPIYQVRADGDSLDLRLTWPNETIRRECSTVTSVLPEEYRLERQLLRRLRAGTVVPGDERTGELVSLGVLVPLPQRYLSTDWATV